MASCPRPDPSSYGLVSIVTLYSFLWVSSPVSPHFVLFFVIFLGLYGLFSYFLFIFLCVYFPILILSCFYADGDVFLLFSPLMCVFPPAGPLAALLLNSCTIAQRSMMTKFVANDEVGKSSHQPSQHPRL